MWKMTDDGWQVEPKPAPPELAEDFEAERFQGSEPLRNDPFLVPVLEKLDQASLETLSRILGGWPISSDD
jgi:hypothetical protein